MLQRSPAAAALLAPPSCRRRAASLGAPPPRAAGWMTRSRSRTRRSSPRCGRCHLLFAAAAPARRAGCRLPLHLCRPERPRLPCPLHIMQARKASPSKPRARKRSAAQAAADAGEASLLGAFLSVPARLRCLPAPHPNSLVLQTLAMPFLLRRHREASWSGHQRCGQGLGGSVQGRAGGRHRRAAHLPAAGMWGKGSLCSGVFVVARRECAAAGFCFSYTGSKCCGCCPSEGLPPALPPLHFAARRAGPPLACLPHICWLCSLLPCAAAVVRRGRSAHRRGGGRGGGGCPAARAGQPGTGGALPALCLRLPVVH